MASTENTQSTQDAEFEAVLESLPQDPTEPGSQSAKSANVLKLLPVHAAPHTGRNPLKVKRIVPGRPRAVDRCPTTTDLEYHAEMSAEKARYIDADALLAAGKRHAEPLTILNLVKIEIMVEAAALSFQRIENEKYGRDTQQTSSRRVDALTKIANIELELKRLGGDLIDVNSEKMQRIFKFFIETVRGILEENLSVEQINLVFNRLQTEFEGWQEKLANVLR